MQTTLVGSYSASVKSDSVISIPNVVAAAGDTIVGFAAFEALSGQVIDAVDWGAVDAMGTDVSQAYADSESHILIAANVAGGTHDYVFALDNTSGAIALVVEVWRGTHATPFDKANGGSGSSTAPSSGATATTTQAVDLLFGMIATNGPQGDAAGSPSNSFTASNRVGSTGGADAGNRTVATFNRNVTATGAYTMAASSITSRPWGCLVVALKINLTVSVTAGVPGATAAGSNAATKTLGGITRTAGASGASAGGSPAATAALGGATATAGAPGATECGAPDIESYAILDYYPPLADEGAAVVVTDPWTGDPLTLPQTNYQSSGRGASSCGQPYLAAVGPAQTGGISGLENTVILRFSLQAMPVQLADPDEIHYLFSIHEYKTGGRELIALGVTPSGRIAATSLVGTIKSPKAIVTADGLPHWITYQAGGLGNLFFDSVAILQSSSPGIAYFESPGGEPTRYMLFNGIAGTTRCACTIYEVEIDPEGTQPVRWPMNDRAGLSVHDEEYISGWLDRTPEPELTDYPGVSYVLAAQWYDPTALGFPLLWGSPSTDSPSSCFKWERRPTYVNRDPAQPSYVQVPRPA